MSTKQWIFNTGDSWLFPISNKDSRNFRKDVCARSTTLTIVVITVTPGLVFTKHNQIPFWNPNQILSTFFGNSFGRHRLTILWWLWPQFRKHLYVSSWRARTNDRVCIRYCQTARNYIFQPWCYLRGAKKGGQNCSFRGLMKSSGGKNKSFKSCDT